MYWLWIGFIALIIVCLTLDLGVFHRGAQSVSIREAGFWTLVWVTLGLSFSGVVYAVYSHHWFGAALRGTGSSVAPGKAWEAMLLYLTGYVLEESLSIDNLFVIALIFTHFKVEERYRRRVLFWGILGAVLLRATMILGGTWLVTRFSWVFYVFGAYLAYAGLKLFKPEVEEADPEHSLFIRWARRLLPVAEGDHGQRFFVRVDGRTLMTRLALVLVAVEGTDVIFALDSVPAILAISTDSFIVFTSNIFAILGLRSLFFVLQGMMGRFEHLKMSLAFVLVFIGAKMCLHAVLRIPNWLSLGVILGAVGVGVVSSLMLEKARPAAD